MSANVPREQLASALSGFLTEEQMRLLIDEVLAIKKRVRVEMVCKKCGAHQIQFGEASDAKAVALALPDLLNQAYGRPGEEVHQRDPITFVRYSIDDLTPSKPDPKPVSKAKPGRPRKTVGRPRPAPKVS